MKYPYFIKPFSIVAICIVGSLLVAQEKSEIQFPSNVQPVTPVPISDSITIKKNQYYVIKSDTELVADWYGVGDISVSLRNGRKKPLTIPTEWAIGWKADASDPEFVTFNDTNLCIIKGSKSGNVTLKIIPAVNNTIRDKAGNLTQIPLKRSDIINKTLIIDMGDVVPTPNPPPQPNPPDPPSPKLDDAPVTTSGLYVIFLVDTTKTLSITQHSILYSAETTGWLNKNCDVVNKSAQYRVISKDTTTTIEPYATILKRKQSNYPWVVMISGKKFVYEGLVDSTSGSEFIKLASKYKTNTRYNDCPECAIFVDK